MRGVWSLLQKPCFIFGTQPVLDGPGLPSKMALGFQAKYSKRLLVLLIKRLVIFIFKFIYVNLLFGPLLLISVFLSKVGHPCDVCHGLLHLTFRFTKPAL